MSDDSDMSFDSVDTAEHDTDISSSEVEEPMDFPEDADLDFDEDFSDESETFEDEASYDAADFDEVSEGQDFDENTDNALQDFSEAGADETDMYDSSDFEEEVRDSEDVTDMDGAFLSESESAEYEDSVSAADFSEASPDGKDLDEDTDTGSDFTELQWDGSAEEQGNRNPEDFFEAAENQDVTGEESDPDSSDDPPKVLKRDENDLRQSGDKAIEKRLEAKEDDYRDKGLSEEEVAMRLEADREEYEKEFADDSPYGDSSSEETSEVDSYTAETNENYSDSAGDELSGDENKLEYGDYPPEAEEVPEVEEPYRARRTESTELSEEVSEGEEPYRARRTEGTEPPEKVPEVEDPYRARRTESTEQSEEVPEAEEPYRARRTEGTEQPEEEPDWERTSLNPENEAIIRDMDDNGEIDIPEVNPNWKEPKETEPHRPTIKSGEFEGERGNSAFYPKDHEVLDDMARFGQDHVDYVDNNPDFSPFAVHDTPWGEADSTVEIGHMTDQRKNPGIEGFRRPQGSSHDIRYDLGNFSQADNALAESIKARYPDSNVTPELIEKYRTDQKLVWHECADGKTMQLVPEKIHNACRHSGGVSVEKRNMAYGDITAPIDD